ncbi:hypothetical protein ACSFA0_14675 [Variovorax sp. LT1P1]|uniref:hypothetical protein n=1 Tax=Variovorax sp. LT1P1 TaxID=3443730 RepID=UPI003F4871BF
MKHSPAKAKPARSKVLMTQDALTRMQRAAVKSNGVGTQEGSHIAVLQSQLTKGARTKGGQ